MTSKKLRIQITEIYPRERTGFSKNITVEGVGLKQAYNRIKELFEEE